MRVLFLSQWFPYPPNNGSKLRIFHLLRGLAQCHEVTLLSFADQPEADPRVPELLSLCTRVQIVPLKPYNPERFKARVGMLSPKPRYLMDTFSPEMANKISEILSTGKYDLVIASQFMMASYHAYFEQVPSIFEEVEVGVLYEQLVQAKSFGQRLRYGLTWAKYRRYLAHLVDRFAACTVVSDQEQRMLRDAVIGDYQPVEIVPNCVDVASYSDVLEGPQANTLIYTGSFTYFANYQAASWFLNQVYPIVQAQVPDVHLTITGNHEDRPIPPAANVTLTGFVDDVRPYVASSWISLAPIWIGGGTRLKILEAMALRTPVVATSKGIEGLAAKHEKHILVADTPEYFAEAVIRLLRDPGLRQRLTDYAYNLVLERYDWAVVMPRFLSLVERTAYD